MDSVDLEIEANKEKACALAKELKILNQRTHEQQMMQKAKNKVEEKRSYTNDRLTHKEHRPNAIIKPEVCKLICKNVVGNGMKVSEAMKTFNVNTKKLTLYF